MPIGEASVMGGDYGRWKPATSAAERIGSSLASAISKKTEMDYIFSSDGMAQSADNGSDIWFAINPKKSGDDIYYLGFNIYGDKEKPNWKVMLKVGKGLGSAKSIATEKASSSDELNSACSKLVVNFKD